MRVLSVGSTNFRAHRSIHVGDKNGTTFGQIGKDICYNNLAKYYGVDIPYYNFSAYMINNRGYEYETQGEVADYETNPITSEHLKSLTDNILRLDRAGINHQDLELTHCYYASNGKTQFDCFKFAQMFCDDISNFPEFELPSNLVNYEKNSLSFYIEQIPTKGERIEFAKKYLKNLSAFHLLKSKKVGLPNVKCTIEMLENEKTKARALACVDDTMADLFLDKLSFLNQERKAFTLWDEGHGACGNEPDINKSIHSVPEFLEAAKLAYGYSEKAKTLANSVGNETKKEYYDLEARVGKHYGDMYLQWCEGMAKCNLEDVKAKDIKQAKERYKEIFEANPKDKIFKIDDYIMLYRVMVS